MNKMNKILCSCLLLFFLCGCYSSNVIQTGKPLNKKEFEFAFAAGAYAGIELTGRLGVGAKMDIGASIVPDLNGQYRFDIKRLIGQTKSNDGYFSIAIGVDFYEPESWFNGQWPLNGPTLSFYYSFHHDRKWMYYSGLGLHFEPMNFAVYRMEYENTGSPSRFSTSHSMVLRGGFGVRKQLESGRKFFIEASSFVRSDYRVFTGSGEISEGLYNVNMSHRVNVFPTVSVGYIFSNNASREYRKVKKINDLKSV